MVSPVSVRQLALHPLLQLHSAEPLLAEALRTAATPSSASVSPDSDSPSSHLVEQSIAAAHRCSGTEAGVPPKHRLVVVRIAGLERQEERRGCRFGKT